MTEKIVSHVWIGVLVLALCLLVGFVAVGNANVTEDEVKDIVVNEFNKLDIPTATEIASEIVVEVPEWEVPVIPEFKSDNKVNDLWENLYSGVIAVLKGNATEDAKDELDELIYEAKHDEDGDFFDFLKLNILNFDELEDDFNYEDVEITVLELGLEEEDKVAQVVFEFEIEYSLSVGPSNDEYEKTVFATADVVYEYDEEEPFKDVDVEFAFVLE